MSTKPKKPAAPAKRPAPKPAPAGRGFFSRLLSALLYLTLLAGILLARVNEFVRRPLVRIASGLLVLGFGIYGLIGLMRLLHWI
jgi:hypothetical protein